MSVHANQDAATTPRGKQMTNNGYAGIGGGGRDRGQNINHLLSFTLPPRARPPAPVSRRSRRSGPSQPFNKERYVAAQYRFLVKPTGDYTAYFADADIYLNWGDILSVLIPTSSALSGASTSSLHASSQPSLETHEGAACPICLSPPTAPRMTKCGHVYCYPCILQYLATTDGPANMGPLPVPGAAPAVHQHQTAPLTGPTNRQWMRCPICWDAVYARDLKAVKWWDPKAVALDRQDDGEHSHEEAGEASTSTSGAPSDWLRMRLIERPQITTQALPQSSTWPTSSTSPSDQPLIAQHQAPWHFQPDVMAFAKFMLATPDLLLTSLTQDVDELAAEKNLLTSLGGGGAASGDNSLAYVDLAERKVREQMAKVVNELDIPAVRSAIGQAKNDLKEHDEAEKGRRLREGENLSRRQRRQAEKEQQAAAAAAAEAKLDEEATKPSEEAAGDAGEQTEKPVESSAGAEDFLALRASSQGGSYGGASPAARTESAPDSAKAVEDEQAPVTPLPASSTKASQRPRRNLNPPNPSPSSFFFYQASSGQNIFMHPLDIKILHSQFGSYGRFPRDIAVKVQSAEEGSMNEELRKRCRYLTHLPRGTDVVFIEIDWEAMASGGAGSTTPLVSKATLKPYEQVLRARRNKRRDKERREDRAKVKAEEAEAARRPPITTTTGSSGAQAMGIGGGGRRSRDGHAFDHQLSQSYGSSSDGGGGRPLSTASGYSGGGGAGSPTFMEAAMWGAERHFPIHPGADGGDEEDFPAVAPSSGGPGPSPPLAPSSYNNAAQRTVWGTPAAARPSFASTLHASSRGGQGHGGAGWDDDVDDAWLELEEGFVLGTNNSRQVRQGRGLNTQQVPSQQKRNGNNGGDRTPQPQKVERPSWSRQASSQQPSQQPQPATQVAGKEEGADSTAAPAGAKGKKQRKAKLVLTGGGRGTA